MTVNTLGSNEQDRSSRTVAEWLWPFLPMGISAFSLSALIWYHLRRDVFERDIHSALQLLYANLYKLIGFAPSVLFFLLALTWSSIWFATGKVDRPLGRLGRLLAMTVMIGILINLGHGDVAPAVHKGELGAWFAEHLVGTFGYLASLLVVWAVTFASMLLATDFFFSDSFERLRTGHGGELATESGVETAVTDHLRGLGTSSTPLVVPTPSLDHARHVPLAGAAAAAGAVGGAVEASAEPLVIDEPAAAEPVAEPPAEPVPEPRRRSYAERRRERERRWEQEEWLPPAPESQEIENPEANALAALDAAAVTPAEPPAPTAAMVTPMAAAAPAEVDAPAVLDGDAETGADLVDVDELEDMVGDDEEVAGHDLDDDSDDDDSDDDDSEAEHEPPAAPREIERPLVIGGLGAAPIESSFAAARAELTASAGDDEADLVEPGFTAARADDAEVEVSESAADADEVDAAEDEATAGDVDEDDAHDAEPEVTEAHPSRATPASSAIDDEPLVAIPRPETPGVWSQVVWRPSSPPAAPPPVEIPTPASTVSPEPVASREQIEPRELLARDGAEERGAARQQQLFGSWLDEGLIQDAIEVVTSTRRANAALLQRKLRIDYALAIDVLAALAARGVVELEGDSTQGRVLV